MQKACITCKIDRRQTTLLTHRWMIPSRSTIPYSQKINSGGWVDLGPIPSTTKAATTIRYIRHKYFLNDVYMILGFGTTGSMHHWPFGSLGTTILRDVMTCKIFAKCLENFTCSELDMVNGNVRERNETMRRKIFEYNKPTCNIWDWNVRQYVSADSSYCMQYVLTQVI